LTDTEAQAAVDGILLEEGEEQAAGAKAEGESFLAEKPRKKVW
jgi:hypothetical protein